MPTRIEDYALLGDCETAALVSTDGSIDWLCWPRFDSPACFAALLGGPEHGRWRIAPAREGGRIRRRYRPNTMILETEIETADGAVTVIDFMPPRGDASDLVRLVVGRRGQVAMCSELILRFGYGSIVPWVTRMSDGALRAIAGPDMVMVRSEVPLHGERLTTIGEFSVAAGETVSFVMTHGPSYLEPPRSVDPMAALAETEQFWREWADRCTYKGDWKDAVFRSLLTLKALTHRHTGGIVAACGAWSLEGAAPGLLLDVAVEEEAAATAFLGASTTTLGEQLARIATGAWQAPAEGVGLDASDTAAAVLDCVVRATSLRDGLLRAIRLGGDTDTVAALVGGILAAGLQPDEVRTQLPWHTAVQLPDDATVTRLAAGLTALRARPTR